MTSIPSSGTNGVSRAPSVEQVKASLPDGETPMDILNAIMAGDSNVVVTEQSKVPLSTPITEEPQVPRDMPEPPKQTLKEETPSDEVEVEKTLTESLLELDKPDNNVGKNISNLRKAKEKLEKELEDARKALETKESELTKYQTGEILPEVLFEKEQRIQELEKYEAIHGLKNSKAFRQKYIEPINETKAKLVELGKEYSVSEEVMERAIGITDRRELNRFISNNFDDLDGIEVKKMVNDIQGLMRGAREAELDSKNVLKELEETQSALEREAYQKRVNQISTTAKKAWTKNLLDIRKEGKFYEYIPKEEDPEYNEKYVTPITKMASTEYGKVVARLGELGLKDLPEDLADALAQMVLRGVASENAAHTRHAAITEAEAILESTKRRSSYARPAIGGGFGGGITPTSNTPKKETPDDIVNNLIATGIERANQKARTSR